MPLTPEEQSELNEALQSPWFAAIKAIVKDLVREAVRETFEELKIPAICAPVNLTPEQQRELESLLASGLPFDSESKIFREAAGGGIVTPAAGRTGGA